ncbi:MAG: PD-(D/E)XK nuclease family protein [Acidobacteria bacterium]|nr:PD-(D/E)XK nuclease family protein [Acidobacteriota bacterium]
MLLIGPPGSGKTHFVLEAIESALRQGRDREVVLIVPTASMAEHLLHTLARRGLAVPNRVVQTVAHFVDQLTPDVTEASPAFESWVVEGLLREAERGDLRELAAREGFRELIIEAMRELTAAGCSPSKLTLFCRTAHQQAFQQIFERFQIQLKARGCALHGEKLRLAAESIDKDGLGEIREVYLDGFFQLSPGERAFVETLAKSAAKFVATAAQGVESSFPDLPTQRLETVRRASPETVVVRTRNREQEVEDIARRILAERRPFHECGVVVRAPDAYGPLIQEVFERFRIPFRMRVPMSLARHGAVSYLRDLLQCVAGGFEEQATLALVGRQWCPAGLTVDADEFDFEARKRLPGGRMDFLLREALRFPKVHSFLEDLRSISGWTRERQTASIWKDRVCTVSARFVRLPDVADGLTAPQVLEMRRTARALAAFAQAAEQATRIWNESEEISFAEYVRGLDLVLSKTPLPEIDGRRNVVHVLTVYEARQWELPVVFVCGLIEKQFPRHYSQNLFFPDADRRRMKRAGIAMRTVSKREEEERFLFRIATTRATDSLYLSYPESNESDTVNVRSFLIETPKQDDVSAPAVRINEKPAEFHEPRQASLGAKNVRESMMARHAHFRPSSIETYLKCPFLFFGQHTLKLEGPPDPPERRINSLVSGTIVHQTLQGWAAVPETPIAEVLSEVFATVCDRESIQTTFQTAVTFNSLRADLDRFAREEQGRGASNARERLLEAAVEFVVEDPGEAPFQLHGRIDRYELFDRNLAVVVDYKYSSKGGMAKLATAHKEGRLVQGALYLLGLEQARGVKPGGIRYWGLRGDTTRVGWISDELAEEPDEGGEQEVSPEELQRILDSAQATTAKAIEEIRNGRMEAAPYDFDPCLRYCPLRDVCRIRP